MNELYNSAPQSAASQSDRRRGNPRRWMYMSLAILAAVILMWIIPPDRTVRLAYAIRPDNAVMMEITLPAHCRIRTVYLRADEKVPRTGKLLTLVLNGEAFEVNDWETLPKPEKVECNANEECRTPNAMYPSPEPGSKWEVWCKEVNPAIAGDSLNLVVEVTGPADTVKEWNKIVRLVPLPTDTEKPAPSAED